jgi:hypothetical protein
MPKNKKAKTLKYGLATAVIGQSIVPVATVFAEEVPTNNDEEQTQIELQITQQKDVDVVLTLGDTDVDATNFKSDLLRELQKRNIDPSRVNIQAITTQEQNIQTEFNWNKDVPPNVGSIQIQNNGSKIQMHGNPTNAGFTKIYTDNNRDPNIKEQEISFSYNLDYGDNYDGAGVLLNTHVENGALNGYAIIFLQNQNAKLYKLTDWRSGDEIYIGGSRASGSVNPKAQLIASVPMGNSGSYSLKITKDSITVVKNGQEIGTYNLPQHFGWGFGFFGDHYSHGCPQIGQFSLENIKLVKTYAEEFKDLIRQPKWRDNTERFVVNLEDNKLNDLDDPSTSGEILTRLMNENIHYVGLGTSANKQQVLDFIARNNNDGIFVDNTNYTQAIESIADYIVEELNNNVKTVTAENPYVVAGVPVDFNVTPESLKANTETPEYPKGRWKFDHNPDYFENGEGLSSLATGYRSSLPVSFDKPGEYEIWFGDTHPNPRHVYVHRRPIADFSMNITKTPNGVTVTTVDNSYDLDHQSEENKGIVEKKWRWKETTASTWNDGQLPANLPAGKNYLLQLQVKDVEGEWSTPVTKYVTTDEAVKTTPIANFTVSTNTLVIDKELEINDSSYDPSGKALTQKQWKVFKDNNYETPVYTGSTPVTDFSSYGLGEYMIELTVTNADGTKSEPFSRTIKVVEQAYLDSLDNITEMNKQLENINTAEGLENLQELANETQELINGLQEGEDKEHAQSEFSKINQYIEGTAKVNELEDKADNLYTQQALDEAEALYNDTLEVVNGLPEGSIKDDLKERLDDIREAIDHAQSILINAELVNEKEVSLSWLPYEGADSYRVYVHRLNPTTGEYEEFSFPRAANGETLEITGLKAGHTYMFEVYPRKNGVEITEEPIGTAAIDIPVPEPEPVPVVQNVTATVSGTEATVTWDKLDNAIRYRVQAYVKDPTTGEFVKNGFGRTTSSESIVMKNLDEGKTYKFEVVPNIDYTYLEEAAGISNEVTVEVAEVEGPVVNAALNVTIEGTTAHLSWDAIEDASRYRVQKYIKDEETGEFVQDGYAKAVNGTEVSFENLKSGAEYKFEVTPRIGWIYNSDYTISKTASVGEVEESTEEKEEITPITNAHVVMEGSRPTIYWDPLIIDGEEITQYRITRYALDKETGQYVKDNYSPTVTGTSYTDTYYIDKNVTKFRYEITPRTSSMYAPEHSITIYDVTTVADGTVQVFFASEEGQTGSYTVQRYIKDSEGNFVKDGEPFDVTGTNFVDDTADPEKEYKYVITQN